MRSAAAAPRPASAPRLPAAPPWWSGPTAAHTGNVAAAAGLGLTPGTGRRRGGRA